MEKNDKLFEAIKGKIEKTPYGSSLGTLPLGSVGSSPWKHLRDVETDDEIYAVRFGDFVINVRKNGGFMQRKKYFIDVAKDSSSSGPLLVKDPDESFEGREYKEIKDIYKSIESQREDYEKQQVLDKMKREDEQRKQQREAEELEAEKQAALEEKKQQEIEEEMLSFFTGDESGKKKN